MNYDNQNLTQKDEQQPQTEFSLNSLRADPRYSEETKGIEYGLNPGKTAKDYLLWSYIISAICAAVGAIFS